MIIVYCNPVKNISKWREDEHVSALTQAQRFGSEDVFEENMDH